MSGWGRWEQRGGGGEGWGQQAYRNVADDHRRRYHSRSRSDRSSRSRSRSDRRSRSRSPRDRRSRSRSPRDRRSRSGRSPPRKRRPAGTSDDHGDDDGDDELSLKQLVAREHLGTPGVESDLAASTGDAISAEFRNQHGVAPAQKHIAGERFKVSVYGKRDHKWIIELLRKATRGEALPVVPTAYPSLAAHGGWRAATRNFAVGAGNAKTEYTCTACNETKHRTAFSNKMIDGNKSVMRCKICVNGATVVAAAGTTERETVESNCTMLCSVCDKWKDASDFSNSQRRGRQKKCRNCAACASSALLYRCVYCHDNYSDDTNPVSKFPREFRDPPFGPCCHRGECITEYRKRQCGGDEARKKAEQLEKAAAAMKAEAAATKAALEDSLANHRQEIADKERALNEAQAQQSSMSQAAHDAKIALETEQQRKRAQLEAMDTKFASEKAKWEARKARFEHERSELTQTIKQVEKDKQKVDKEKEHAVEEAEMHQDTVENMATTLSRWQTYADKLKEQLYREGVQPLSWADFKSGGFH